MDEYEDELADLADDLVTLVRERSLPMDEEEYLSDIAHDMYTMKPEEFLKYDEIVFKLEMLAIGNEHQDILNGIAWRMKNLKLDAEEAWKKKKSKKYNVNDQYPEDIRDLLEILRNF